MANNSTSLDEWSKAIKGLFPSTVPDRAVWTNQNDIVRVLNDVARGRENCNHTFLPISGGLDLHGAKLAGEEECIELDLNGMPYIVRPLRLIFRCYGPDLEWSFFRLETGGLQPIGDDIDGRKREQLYEVAPGQYIDCDEDADDLPDDARHVIRYFNGAFVTFAKESDYNLESYKGFDAYDAPHDEMTAEEFEKLVAHLRTL